MTLQVHVPHGILSKNEIMEQEGLIRVTQPSCALLEPGMTEAHNLLSGRAVLKASAATSAQSVDIQALSQFFILLCFMASHFEMHT